MLVFFALGIPLFFGSVAMVVDIGVFWRDQRHLQNAVDASALAAARSMPGTSFEMQAIVDEYFRLNGFDPLAPGLTVSATPGYGGDPERFEVSATMERPALFARVFGIVLLRPRATAIAEHKLIPRAGSYSFIALDPTSCDSFVKAGGANVFINGGGIMVNSSCASGTHLAGNGSISGTRFDYFGDGGVLVEGSGSYSPLPEPTELRIEDPLLGLPAIDPALTPMSPDSGGTAAAPATASISGNTTIRPGTFYGGISITGSGAVHLESGIYVMAGGGFATSGSGSVTSDGPVMIYNTAAAVAGPRGAGLCAPVDLSGGVPVSLEPMHGGPYDGISVWQDEACSSMMYLGGGTAMRAGVVYAPNALVRIAGGGVLNSVQTIAKNIIIAGNSDVTVLFQDPIGKRTYDRSFLIK